MYRFTLVLIAVCIVAIASFSVQAESDENEAEAEASRIRPAGSALIPIAWERISLSVQPIPLADCVG